MNTEELLIGLCFGLLPVYWIKGFVLLTAPICAYFWARTGAGDSKAYRRVGCPAIVAVAMAVATRHWPILAFIPIGFGILSIGYGIPDNTDPGSALGRFWYKISPKFANVLTRSTIYFLILSTFFPLTSLK